MKYSNKLFGIFTVVRTSFREIQLRKVANSRLVLYLILSQSSPAFALGATFNCGYDASFNPEIDYAVIGGTSGTTYTVTGGASGSIEFTEALHDLAGPNGDDNSTIRCTKKTNGKITLNFKEGTEQLFACTICFTCPGENIDPTETTCPTFISLASLDALVQDGQVILSWTTGSEIDNAGFNILRSDMQDGPYLPINDVLILAKAIPPGGANYSIVDTDVEYFLSPGNEIGKTYFYTLEDVDTSGSISQHGPLEIKIVEGATTSFDVSTEQVQPAVVDQNSASKPSSGGCSVIKDGPSKWDISLFAVFFGLLVWRGAGRTMVRKD